MKARDFAAGAAATLFVLGASAVVTARPSPGATVQTLTESPKKGLDYLTLSPADFYPNHPTAGVSHYATNPYAGATTSASLVPIHLPTKVRIEEVACYGLRDDDDGRDLQFDLVRLDLLSTAKEEKLVSVKESVADDLEAFVAGGLSITIDNFQYGYFLRYDGPSKMRLRGCRIGYRR